MAFGQIKTKKDQPRKFVVGVTQSKHPVRLGVSVMSAKDKDAVNRRRVGSRKVTRTTRPLNAASSNRPR